MGFWDWGYQYLATGYQTESKLGIPLIGDGRQLMDMTCVENVALAIRLGTRTPEAKGEVYNITNGDSRAFRV